MATHKSLLPDILCLASILYLVSHLLCMSLASTCAEPPCLTLLVDVTDFMDPGWIMLDGLALPTLQLCACGALKRARYPMLGEKQDPLGYGALLCLYAFAILYLIFSVSFEMWLGNWNEHKTALLIFLTTGIITICTALFGTFRHYDHRSLGRETPLKGSGVQLEIQSARMV